MLWKAVLAVHRAVRFGLKGDFAGLAAIAARGIEEAASEFVLASLVTHTLLHLLYTRQNDFHKIRATCFNFYPLRPDCFWELFLPKY